MSRWIKYVAVIVVALFVLVPLASAGQGADQTDVKDIRRQNMQRAEEKKCFGQFTEEGQTVEGKFVKFGYNASKGVITDYRVYNGEGYVEVFSKVRIADFSPIESHLSGAVFWMNGSHAKMILHNNPSSIMQIVNPYDDVPIDVTYHVSDGIEINEGSTGSAKNVILSTEQFTGYINTPLNVSLNEKTIDVVGETNSTDTGHSMYMTEPTFTGRGKAHMEMIQENVRDGKIGGEIGVIGDQNSQVSHKVSYRKNLQMQVKSMEKNRLRVRVQSEESNGTCVMMRVNKEALNLEKNEIQVKMDGEKAKKMAFEEVCQGGEQVKYSIQESNEVYEIAVNVPSFSEHTITVEKAADNQTPGFVLPVFLISVATVSALWVWKKKR